MKLKRRSGEPAGMIKTSDIFRVEPHQPTLNERLGINAELEERELSYLDMELNENTAQNVNMLGVVAMDSITLFPEKENLVIEKVKKNRDFLLRVTEGLWHAPISERWTAIDIMRQCRLDPPKFTVNDISWMETGNKNGLPTRAGGKVNIERLVESLQSFMYLRKLRPKTILHPDISAWIEQIEIATLDGLNNTELIDLVKTVLRFDIKLHKKLHDYAMAREDRLKAVVRDANKTSIPGQASKNLATVKLLWAEELTVSPSGFLQAVNQPKGITPHPKLPERSDF